VAPWLQYTWLASRSSHRFLFPLYDRGYPEWVCCCCLGNPNAAVECVSQWGWNFPVPMDMPNRPQPSEFLLHLYIGTGFLYGVFQGVIYGTRTALFMDICKPAVAGTQFTAYMAMLNLVNSYSTKWQCWIVEKIGYPKTLMMDVALGMVCLLFIPMMTKHEEPE